MTTYVELNRGCNMRDESTDQFSPAQAWAVTTMM